MAKGSSKDSKTPKFIIANNNLALKRDIINIAGNLGLTYTQFLRGKIIEIRNSYPEHMKKPPLD